MDASDDCGSVDAVNLRDLGCLSLLSKTCWKMAPKPLPWERRGVHPGAVLASLLRACVDHASGFREVGAVTSALHA